MINLLPPEVKNNLSLERKKRLMMILWLFVAFFLFCFSLVLYSAKIYFQIQVESYNIILGETERRMAESEVQELGSEIKAANDALTKLHSFYKNKVYMSGVLEKIANTLPQETFLTNISTVVSSEEEDDSVKVSLSGFAPTREKLFELKNNLEKNADFEEVSFPSLNWVKPTDIDFLVTFTISQ